MKVEIIVPATVHTIHVHAADADDIQEQLSNILKGVMTMAKDVNQVLADLLARVKAQDTKLDSLRTYNEGLRQAVLDAINAKQQLTPEQEAAAKAVFDVIDKNDAEIDEAMTANTVPQVPPVA